MLTTPIQTLTPGPSAEKRMLLVTDGTSMSPSSVKFRDHHRREGQGEPEVREDLRGTVSSG